MAARLVVVGSDAAGMSAASQARRLQPDLEIVAFERGKYVSYSACGEPYYVGGLVAPIDRLVVRTPEEFAARGIEVHTRHEVFAIDLDRREVGVRNLENSRSELIGFDHLMYATGSRPLRPDEITGIDGPGVFGLRTLEDAVQLKQIADQGPGHAVMVGGGYIGIEMAEAMIDRGWQVSMPTSGRHVLERTLDDSMGALADRAVREYGVELLTDATVTTVEYRGSQQVVSGQGFSLSADLVVIGLGAGPEVDFAVAAGIPLGGTGAVAVDDRQATGVPGVWSGGDCAEVRHRVSGLPVNMLLGTVANKTGRIAGTNLAKGDARFPGVLGTAITRIGSTEISRTGLKVNDAEEAGFSPVTGFARGTVSAGYWPDSAPMAALIVADRDTGRLLGGQIVGGPGAGKRIDVIAMAIWSEMTAAELAWVDLAYAPPFAGVWDLIHIAARRAADG